MWPGPGPSFGTMPAGRPGWTLTSSGRMDVDTTIDQATDRELTLMQRVALTRLNRFARVAKVAEQSDSPIWQTLARRSAANAYRDCLLLGLADQDRVQAA